MFASIFIKDFGQTGQSAKVLLCFVFAVALVGCGGSAPQAPRAKVEAPEVTQVAPDVQDENAASAAVPSIDVIDPEITQEADAQIIVGVMLPLSGPEAGAGEALLRAVTMALFDAYDPRIKLIPLDTRADALVAAEKAQEAVDTGVSVVLGPLLADSVVAAGSILQAANITMIGFSNDVMAAAPERFIMGFLPQTEVKRVVDYAVAQGLQNFAALVPEGLYGQRVQSAFGDAVVDAGVNIAAIENYPPGIVEALDEPVKRLARYDERRRDARREARFLRGLRDSMMNEIAEKIEAAEVMEGVDFDAVLVPEGGAVMRSLAPLLPFYEVDPNIVKFLGTGLWNDAGLLGEPPMQGAWFAAPEPEQSSAFLARYEQTYNMPAPRIATLAYDAMSLVAQLARAPLTAVPSDVEQSSFLNSDGNNDSEDLTSHNRTLFSPSRLTTREGFTGVDGLFRFLPDGTIERALAVLEVNRSGFTIVDPAPKSFPAFGYLLN